MLLICWSYFSCYLFQIEKIQSEEKIKEEIEELEDLLESALSLH